MTEIYYAFPLFRILRQELHQKESLIAHLETDFEKSEKIKNNFKDEKNEISQKSNEIESERNALKDALRETQNDLADRIRIIEYVVLSRNITILSIF